MRNWKKWLKAAAIRAVKTVAQTAVATIGTSAVLGEVNWAVVASASALAGVLSLLTALLLGMPMAGMWHFRIDHGAWSVIDYSAEFVTLRVLNSRAIWLPEAE